MPLSGKVHGSNEEPPTIEQAMTDLGEEIANGFLSGINTEQ